MSNQASYQNDVDRLGDRVKLVLESLNGAPGVDQEILIRAGALLGMGFAGLDTAIDPEKSEKFYAE